MVKPTPQLRPLNVLLLENIHPLAKEIFEQEGYHVTSLPKALKPEELKTALKGIHILGIRSKSSITADIIDAAPDLISIGCFCIGTNQVDLAHAKKRGVVVFNAPFGNTRSVAEMVLSEVIMLSRQLGQRSMEVHRGEWNKVSNGCFEVRSKVLGIIGYGNIGSQISTLAEAAGMQVIFYDVLSKLPLGNAKGMGTLNELLKTADFVTLHVPATAQTTWMIGDEQLAMMKKGSYLINASRGQVVDISALAKHLKSGHLAGAAIDVYPEEPEANTLTFKSALQGLPNVILTPHIGGATEEAQANIGAEVPVALIRYAQNGSTARAVNFPHVDIAPTPSCHRIVNTHKNVPGVLREINRIISDSGANIQAQALATDAEIGYLVLDVDKACSSEARDKIASLPQSITTRVLS
jgi:D-3-phosphoglycerate dehydrogenase